MAKYKEVCLSNADDKWAKVDAEDYERITSLSWSWHARGNHARGSRRVNGKVTTVYMHREVLQAPKGSMVDHINGDGLDNRKCNLRFVTYKQNGRNRRMRKDNTTGFKGVCQLKSGKFQTSINCKVIGVFDTAVEAARAYDKAAIVLHGEYGRLNFPDERH